MKKLTKLAALLGSLTIMACNSQQMVVDDFATYPEYTKGDLGLTY